MILIKTRKQKSKLLELGPPVYYAGMEVALTWNLVILAVAVMLFMYSFIIGQDQTIKLILSIYIAILTSDGIASLLERFVFDPSPGWQAILYGWEDQFFMWLRITLLIIAAAVFVVKSGFHVTMGQHEKWSTRMVIHALFAALSAALFLSTILIYMSGNSFVEGMSRAVEGLVVYEQSLLAQILIDYYQIWFTLPAISFLVTSFFFEAEVD